MRRGFTIIELLVASLLLGLLVSILTMIFNQSSISWRVGIAGTADLRAIRENIAEIREEADNAFVHDGKLYRITGLWDKHGNLRNRACDAPGSTDENENSANILGGGTARTGAGKWIGSLTNLRPEDLKAWQEWNTAMKALYPKAMVGLPVQVDATGQMRSSGFWKKAGYGDLQATCLISLQLMVHPGRYLPAVPPSSDRSTLCEPEVEVEVDI